MATRIGRRWRQDERDRALRLRSQGWAYPRIGGALGRSASGVQNALRGRVPKGGNAIKNFEAGRHWTPEEDAKIRAQVAVAGSVDLAALGEALGRSKHSIRRRIDRKHRDLLSDPPAQQELPLASAASAARQNGTKPPDLSRADWLAIGIRYGWLNVSLKEEPHA